ncbi:MAG: dephospho-CoA kinase [Chlamydiota bacterium]
MRKVAVTGGLASGKSTVCLLFEKKGAYRVSADAIIHQLLSSKTSARLQVINLLGPDILEGDIISRSRIASSVFSSPEKLKKLESILHPAALAVIEQEYQKAIDQKAPLFIAEVPLLLESGFEKNFDAVITVEASLEERRKRYKKDDFDSRISHQLSDEERARKADYIIENKGDMPFLEAQINPIFSILTRG